MPFRKSSFTLKNEIELRRRLRIQQAREQANEAARIVRQRTERAKIKLVCVNEIKNYCAFHVSALNCSFRALEMKNLKSTEKPR